MEQETISMEVVNPKAAGIDVGSRSHWVAVGQSEQDVREFGVFNQDLFAMADWLKEKESTPLRDFFQRYASEKDGFQPSAPRPENLPSLSGTWS